MLTEEERPASKTEPRPVSRNPGGWKNVDIRMVVCADLAVGLAEELKLRLKFEFSARRSPKLIVSVVGAIGLLVFGPLRFAHLLFSG